MNLRTRTSHDVTIAGFTLLELSIVLVIIGLIVGGILVGQELIKAAEIRSTISQVEKYNSAVNTFRNKFTYIPGDIPQPDAADFSLYTLVSETATGQGDGNGLLEGGAAGSVLPQGETLVFWRHLSDSSLIDGALGITGNSIIATNTGLVTGTVSTVKESLPATKLGGLTSYIVYAVNGQNYYQLVPVVSITPAPLYNFGATGMTPIQSYNIDVKLDDGEPNTGIVIARDTGTLNGINGVPTFAASSTANTCIVGLTATDTTAGYNRSLISGGNDTSCSLRLRFN